jgi:pilus assembly protein CpaE
MAETKVFLFSQNQDTEASARQALAATGTIHLVGACRISELSVDPANLLTAAKPEVVYVHSSVDPETALDMAMQAKQALPRVGLLLGLAEKDFDFLQRAMGEGVDSVMPEPLSTGDLVDRIAQIVAKKRAELEATLAKAAAGGESALTTRVAEANAARGGEALATPPIAEPGKGPMMLAFLSSKDGEGKSTVALNLGLSLVKQFGKKVIYVDLCQTLSETAMLLNRKAPGTYLNILAMKGENFSPYGIQRFAIDYFDDQSFLAICGNPTIEPPTVDREALDVLLRFLKTQADFVLLDCPVNFGELLKTSLKLADWHVVVVQNTLSSLRNTRIYLNELKRLEYPRHQVKIVINRVSKAAGLAREDIAKNIDPYPIVGSVVSNGPVAIEAVTVGKPVVLHAPDSDLAESIHVFARRLLGIETSDVGDNEKFSLASMFTSVFGGE